MNSPRSVVVAAASLFSAVIAVPPALLADPPPSNTTGKDSTDAGNNKKKHTGQNNGGNNGNGGNRQFGTKPNGKPVGNMPMKTPGQPAKKAGGVTNETLGVGKQPITKFPQGNPGANNSAVTKQPVTKQPADKLPAGQNAVKTPPANVKTPHNASGQALPWGNAQPGKSNPAAVNKALPKNPANAGNQPLRWGNPPAANSATTNKAPAQGFAKTFSKGPPRQPLSANDARARFDNLRKARTEKVEAGGKIVIKEPGNRTIIKQNNRFVIQHDETERLRRVDPQARFEKGKNGTNIAVINRPGGVKIYSESDANGHLIRRYRRGPDNRDVIIIDNRRRGRGGVGRDIATGVGIGIGVVAGAAILNSVLDVPPPRVRIPRDEYIVDYDGASEESVYDALSAPPVEDFRDRYTLDEIRATAALRDRMRRVDLDDINFEFGSWDVDPSEYAKLERVARAMLRVIGRNPNEVFMIEGYTDAVGSQEDNLSLSDRRAESVAEVLSEQFNVPFENLTTQGYGEDYLKVASDGPERLNRRVAVRRITPLLARGDGSPPPPRRGDDRGPPPGADDRGPPPDDDSGPPQEHYEPGPPAGPDQD